jgi:general nucleoside transport system permease protein
MSGPLPARPVPTETPTARTPIRFDGGLLGSMLPPIVALMIAMVVGDLLILSYGESPAMVYRLLLEGTWGNWYGFGQVLFKTTTLLCTGLAFALAARAGLFNVGAESQLAMGGFAAAMVGIYLPSETPALLAIPMCILAAMVAGAVVGFVPGVLRARFGASEVIVTIMLNFIVLALLNYLLTAHLAVSETLHTAPMSSGTVARLSESFGVFRGSAANWTILVALAAAVLSWWFLFRTRSGYELRAVGLQPDAAEYAGIRVPRVIVIAMMISGALAGLGGINFVLGYKGYYEEGFAAGSGFLGIAVALVGRNHPFGIVLSALLFATLSQGGLAVNAVVPKQLVDILQAVVILAVVTAVPEVQRQIRSAASGAARRLGGAPAASTETGARS